MKTDVFPASVSIAVQKKNDGWIVILPDASTIGPYRNGDIVLEVAVTHALLARKRGMEAQIVTVDDAGAIRRCMILDRMKDPKRCQNCESSWSTPTHRVKCPLAMAIGAQTHANALGA